MKKIIILLFLILFSSYSFGQDWCAWQFKFKFRIDTTKLSGIQYGYKYKSSEVFFNDSYAYEQLRDYRLKFDPLTKEYSLLLNYGCISCGYDKASLPPELYLKINLENNPNGVPFSTVIPIYFEKSDTFKNIESHENLVIDLGTIDVNYFLTDTISKEEKETIEIIEVQSIDSINYRKSKEYKLRKMTRLVKA